MTRIYIIALMIIPFAFSMNGQVETSDFENFGLEPGEFINNDTTGNGFISNLLRLPNDFNEAYQSWSGWAISAMTDTVTPGFTNDLSAITGGGFDNSNTYGVAFTSGENAIHVRPDGSGYVPAAFYEGMYVTNSTFAFLSMLNGDAFAKRFGGETGEDPDFFSIVFRSVWNGEVAEDSIEFFLADYRFENPEDDYIIDEWTWVDLSGLGLVDDILITMRSSDVGEFGINTPSYFCIDDVQSTLSVRSATVELSIDFDIFPNLVDNEVTINLPEAHETEINIFSASGQLRQNETRFGDFHQIELGSLESGIYFLQIIQNGEYGLQKFVKK